MAFPVTFTMRCDHPELLKLLATLLFFFFLRYHHLLAPLYPTRNHPGLLGYIFPWDHFTLCISDNSHFCPLCKVSVFLHPCLSHRIYHEPHHHPCCLHQQYAPLTTLSSTGTPSTTLSSLLQNSNLWCVSTEHAQNHTLNLYSILFYSILLFYQNNPYVRTIYTTA